MDKISTRMEEIVENMISAHQDLRYIYVYIKEFGEAQMSSTCITDLLFENEYIAFIFESEFSSCTSEFDGEFSAATQTYNNMLEASVRRGTVAMQALTITEISKTTGFIREPSNAVNYFNERLYRYIGEWNTLYSILLQTGIVQMEGNIIDYGKKVDVCMQEVNESMTMYGNDLMRRMILC